MVDRQFFDHTNPDDQTFCDRISAAGYPATCQDTDLGPRTACAYCRENIRWGSAGITPNDVMYGGDDGWMTEPADDQGHRWHRETILDGQLKAIGVGVVSGDPFDAGDGATITADFGG